MKIENTEREVCLNLGNKDKRKKFQINWENDGNSCTYTFFVIL